MTSPGLDGKEGENTGTTTNIKNNLRRERVREGRRESEGGKEREGGRKKEGGREGGRERNREGERELYVQ